MLAIAIMIVIIGGSSCQRRLIIINHNRATGHHASAFHGARASAAGCASSNALTVSATYV